MLPVLRDGEPPKKNVGKKKKKLHVGARNDRDLGLELATTGVKTSARLARCREEQEQPDADEHRLDV